MSPSLLAFPLNFDDCRAWRQDDGRSGLGRISYGTGQTGFDAAGYVQPAELGKRPAVIVIDVNYHFTGDKDEPILDSIKKWPNSCGQDAWEALPYIKRLLDSARKQRRPSHIYDGSLPSGWMGQGLVGLENARVGDWQPDAEVRQTNLDGNTINHEVAPQTQDIVIEKLKPSAFHGTPLSSFLTNFKADSVILVGTTTSGCVRASVLDAFSENYHVALAEEGCFDRSQASHAINLCDMNAKYADVISTDSIIDYIDGLEDGLFDLPKGE